MKRYDYEYQQWADRYSVVDRKRGHEKYEPGRRAMAVCREKDDAERIVDLLNAAEAQP